MQVHIILGIGDLKSGPSIPFEKVGVMADTAASPNDPIFLNHHGMIDCILEEWLQREIDNYPISDEIREGHRANDYIVPFMPLYMNNDMFKTAENFGYLCRLPDPTGTGSDSVSVQAYTGLVIGLLAAAVHINM